MTETTQQSQATAINEYTDVLKAMVGKVITVVNPQSYEEAAMGHRLTTGFYKAKILAVGSDFLKIATEFHHAKGDEETEPVTQFIPIREIKRVSVMKSDRLLHL